MSNVLATTKQTQLIDEVLAKTVIEGDLSRLSPRERVLYYNTICKSLGLNPLTKPFELIRLNGKLILYARKDCTDQLRKLHHISIEPPHTEVINGEVFVATVTARTPDGRSDTEIGAVSIKELTGNELCNALMKAVTKSKRRVTLAICGLGTLDESEVETVATAQPQSTYFDDEQVWRQWQTPSDALAWAQSQLPELTLEQLQQEFDALPVEGKKAPAWVKRVNELLLESF